MNHAAVPDTVPAGTVSFLFTDIEGSTERWERDEPAMRLALRRHDAILRETIVANGGVVFKTIGDAFCAAFHSAGSAIAAACAAQRHLGAEDWDTIGGLAVRMAVHTGSAESRDGDYFGTPLNRVARMLGAGYGGQIVVSAASAGLARDALGSETSLRDLGEHRFRGLTGAERVFQVVGPGLRDDFSDLRTRDIRTNLPTVRTSLVGRGDAVTAVAALIATERLVTLAGAGGIGKTRMALAIAEGAGDDFTGGVWFVELAPLGVAGLVAPTLAAVLGIRDSAGRGAEDQIVDVLSGRPSLVVLDNCEHVVAETASLVAALLRRLPGLHVLATTREPLNVGGEQVVRVASLSFPPGDVASAQSALEYEAIALFVERARSADARFRFDDDTAPIVADICRRLDGIALAIELAAARTKIIPPAALRDRLGERFRILTGGDRTALPRQQTMRALIDWSYDLLSPGEQTFLRSAAVFAGAWTFDAAEIVCDTSEGDVFDLLSSLVEKSLVVADVDEGRYRLLESTRAYALEKLIAAGDHEALAQRHARYVGTCVAGWYETYWTLANQRWLPPVAAEIDNVRAALGWALGPGGDLKLGAQISGELEGLWYYGGRGDEGRRWLEAVVARADQCVDDDAIAAVWLALARLSAAKGMVDAARCAVERFERRGDVFGSAYGNHLLAVGLRRMGELDEAERSIDRALSAYARSDRANTRMHVTAIDVRASILRYQGRIDEARLLRSEAMARFEDIGDEHGAATVKLNLADLEAVEGRPERALALSAQAAETFRSAGETMHEAIAVVNAAAFHYLLDENDAALEAARRGLGLSLRAGWRQGVVIAIGHFAALALPNDPVRAARLLGYVNAWFAGERFAREPTEQACYERTLRAFPESFADRRVAFEAEGATLSDADAVALARSPATGRLPHDGT